jgi:hypothetical protein
MFSESVKKNVGLKMLRLHEYDLKVILGKIFSQLHLIKK